MASKQELLDQARALGLEVDEKMTAKQLQALIEDAESGTGDGSADDDQSGEDGKESKNQNVGKATKGKSDDNGGFKYPVYDLWKVDVESLARDKSDEVKKVKLTAVKVIRPNVKIEANAAATINAQSHNSQRRYYAKGTIENGHEEIINL